MSAVKKFYQKSILFISKKQTLFILSFLFILGGLSVKIELVQYFGVFVGAILLLSVYILKRKIQLPRSIILYSLFLILFLINSLAISHNSKKSLEFFSLFLGGGLFWIVSFNLKKELAPWIDKLIIFLGLIFGFLYAINNFFGNPNLIKPWSLYLKSNAHLNHNHIGDFWAMVLIIVGFYLLIKPKRFYLGFFIPLGFYLLLISQSRAALVSVGAGIGYLAYVNKWFERYKKVFIVLIVIITGLFLYIGAFKSILLSRPYFAQSAVGLINNPQGVGMGNFRIISDDTANHVFGLSGFSSVTHNIIFEVLSGLGILGFVFAYWLYKVLSDLWSETTKKNILYKSVFFALTANFFFDSTYIIPTMFWLWFVTLGLSQEKLRG